MARVPAEFPETMTTLQQAIQAQGYTVSRVQRVDVGLTRSGYQTAEYRLVFFGKHDELKRVADRYPDLIPYLPWLVTIFAEGNDTLLVALNPQSLGAFYQDPDLKPYLNRWERDLRAIFDSVRMNP